MKHGGKTALPAAPDRSTVFISTQRIIMQLRSILTLAAVLACGAANAHEYKAGDLRIDHPYARATVPHQPSGAAYMTIENKGKNADRLLSASSPVAKSVQLHAMSMEGNVMKMREVSAIEIKPSGKIVMQPGDGYHFMLIGLSQPLKAGDKFPMTLTFEKAGKADVSVSVEDKDAKAASKEAGAQHQRH
jgi:copper(I)-binding protein